MTARVMALDLGEARIGVAVSDELGISARALEPVRCVGSRKDVNRVADLVREHESGTVVIGLPLSLSGDEGEAAVRSRGFGDELAKRLPKVRIAYQDERLTTVEVERVLLEGNVRRSRRREVVDGMAAVLILKSFLETAGGMP